MDAAVTALWTDRESPAERARAAGARGADLAELVAESRAAHNWDCSRGSCKCLGRPSHRRRRRGLSLASMIDRGRVAIARTAERNSLAGREVRWRIQGSRRTGRTQTNTFRRRIRARSYTRSMPCLDWANTGRSRLRCPSECKCPLQPSGAGPGREHWLEPVQEPALEGSHSTMQVPNTQRWPDPQSPSVMHEPASPPGPASPPMPSAFPPSCIVVLPSVGWAPPSVARVFPSLAVASYIRPSSLGDGTSLPASADEAAPASVRVAPVSDPVHASGSTTTTIGTILPKARIGPPGAWRAEDIQPRCPTSTETSQADVVCALRRSSADSITDTRGAQPERATGFSPGQAVSWTTLAATLS